MTDNNQTDQVPNEEPDEPEREMGECYSCACEIDLEDTGYYTGWPVAYPVSYARRSATPQPLFCNECTTLCNDCSEVVHFDQVERLDLAWDEHMVCTYCFESYESCVSCGYTTHTDNMCHGDYSDEPYCQSCYDEAQGCGDSVHSYSWQPGDRHFWYVALRPEQHLGREYTIPIKFAGLRAFSNLDSWQYQRQPFDPPQDFTAVNKQLFMGYELETNIGECSDLRGAAEFLLSAMRKTDNQGVTLDSEDYLYLKEDGSISGFEIVTHPATLEAHKVLMPRDAFSALAKDHGMVGWAGAGAGLHVHVSKRAFTHAHLHKFQLFHYRNSHWLKTFAGRDSGRWASFDVTQNHNGEPMKLSTLAKGQYERTYLNRYHALNFVPPRTVELRYFRASLKPDTVLAVLEIVHAMWAYTQAHNSSDYRDNGFAWSNFRSWVADQDYEFLVPIMDKRGV
jgi:hypothetical protein